MYDRAMGHLKKEIQTVTVEDMGKKNFAINLRRKIVDMFRKTFLRLFTVGMSDGIWKSLDFMYKHMPVVEKCYA